MIKYQGGIGSSSDRYPLDKTLKKYLVAVGKVGGGGGDCGSPL